MNENTTAQALVGAAQAEFGALGYDGASIRSITKRAGANLGAVTYHFGSKEALYHEVVRASAEPLRLALREAADGPGNPLERIARFVRTYFERLDSDPYLKSLMLQQLVSGKPLPPPVVQTIRGNLETMMNLIKEGQRDGSIREGDPRLLTICIIAQPLMRAALERPLREGAGLDPADPVLRGRWINECLRFIELGLKPGIPGAAGR